MLGYEIMAQGRNLKIIEKGFFIIGMDSTNIKWFYKFWNYYIEEVVKKK